MKQTNFYSNLQIGLHWLVALLVVAAWLTGGGMGKALDQKLQGSYSGGLPPHVVIGLLIAAAVVVRVIVRIFSGTPGPVPGVPEVAAKARHWGHLTLYLLLIAVPIGGIATWFGGYASVGNIHALAGNALIYIAGAHAALALWHHYVRKDNTLRRMIGQEA